MQVKPQYLGNYYVYIYNIIYQALFQDLILWYFWQHLLDQHLQDCRKIQTEDEIDFMEMVQLSLGYVVTVR